MTERNETQTDVTKWKRDRMHLCEPVECYGCNAVSANGGIVYCSTCVSSLRAENERLRSTVATLTEQLREARETTTAVKRNHIVEAQRLIRERDAALAELARLREENEALHECVSDCGGSFDAWRAWHSPGPRALSDPPKGE